MTGKTVIITGANCGLGKVTAQELVKRQARVIMGCRDLQKAARAIEDIRSCTKEGELMARELDLASLRSIQKFANQVLQEEQRIDVLINNAGVYGCPLARTKEGFEMQMGVNHLGHFFLTKLLLRKLEMSSPSRVVIVSSGLGKLGKIDFHNLNSEVSYNKNEAYNNSKLANDLFARELARRTEGSGVCVHCLSPGMVRTQLGRHSVMELGLLVKIFLYPLYWLLAKNPMQGCQTILHCAISSELEGVSGKLYRNCEESSWSEASLDNRLAGHLWDFSEELVSGVKSD